MANDWNTARAQQWFLVKLRSICTVEHNGQREKFKGKDSGFSILHLLSRGRQPRIYILTYTNMQKKCWKDTLASVRSGYLAGRASLELVDKGQRWGENFSLGTFLCLLVCEACKCMSYSKIKME